MHQVVMQPMNSHLRKNPRDDNELKASQLIVIFSIWGKKPRDNNELKASQLIVIFSIWGKKPRDNNEPPGSSSFSPLKKKI